MAEKSFITKGLSTIRNYMFPTPDNPLSEVGAEWRDIEDVKKNLRGYITPVQLQRLRHDIQMWREAVVEAEQAWYPHRVKMQRMYIDTILNGHTLACVNRRKDLTLLRAFEFKDENGNVNEDLKSLFDKRWFSNFLGYVLDAQYFGYSLISLGDVINDGFPHVIPIRRFNISPDRLNVTSYVYSLSGAQFLEEPYIDWHVWVAIPTDIGISKVNYGLLYNVAMYEIICRNLLGQNATAAELYGMPTRLGKTVKTDEYERAAFEAAIANMGSDGYILLDAMDELELVESKGMGSGYKIYENLEQRCEKKISKIILGHSDALDSTAGKLGSSDGTESPAHMALKDKQAADGAFVEDVINGILIPKMINLGFNIDPRFKFKFSNNREIIEAREEEDEAIKRVSEYVKQLTDSGIKVDPVWVAERTGVPVLTDNNNTDQIAQSQLRGSAGGVTGIIQLQQSVANGFTSREAAIATLVYVYGFDQAAASSIVGETVKSTQSAPTPQFTNRVKNKLNELYNYKGK